MLDRDHTFGIWQKAQKAQFTPGANLPVAAAKAEQHREEFESAEQRMEQCKVSEDFFFGVLLYDNITTFTFIICHCFTLNYRLQSMVKIASLKFK